MNILFVYSGLVVDDVNGVYHHNFLDAIIRRYRLLGNLTLCVARKVCECSSQTRLDVGNVRLRFIDKENSIQKRFIDRRKNKQIIQEELQKCDLVIVHVPDSVASLAAAYAVRIHKPYVAVAIGCPWDSLWNHSLKGKMLAPLAFNMMRRTMKHATYAIYVTSRFLQQRYPCQGKVLVCSDVWLPVWDFSVWEKRKQKIEKGGWKTTMKIATSGAVNIRVKGHSDVIRSMAIWKKRGIDVHYYLIGGGDASVLRKEARLVGVEDNVHFMGLCSHQDVFSILDEMDLYIQPSRTEGLSRALVEAMSRALPCVGTTVGGIPELLPEDCLYRPGDLDRLILLIETFSSNRLLQMAESNYERAKDFDTDLLDTQRNDFFREIMNEIAKKQN